MYPKPGAIHFDGANGCRVINAEHMIRSECGNWLSVWTGINQNGSNGRADMTIPRERIVMIEPREKADTTSESKQETTREAKA